MNVDDKNRGSAASAPRWADLKAWLVARPRGRWASARGRWIQTLLTVILLVTGASAWALALIQPWATHSINSAQAGVTTLDAEKMRAIAADLQKIAAEENVPPAAVPQRNPFTRPMIAAATAVHPAPAAGVAAEKPVPAPTTSEKPTLRPAVATGSKAVLEAIKGLRLAVTVVPPDGQRVAIINDTEYREGETVAGFQILEIQEGKVKLQQAGVTCLLRME
jgi:hypothetical protein